MNPILSALRNQIEVKRAQSHLTQLKTNTQTTMTHIFNPRMAADKIAALEKENAALKNSNSIGLVTNSATNQSVVPVTKRNTKTGKLETVSMTLPEAAAHSRKMAGTTTAPKPTTSAPVAPPSGPKLATAADFAKPDLTMSKTEFDKMKPADKSRFCTSGGKLV